jgi:hypothetical protein
MEESGEAAIAEQGPTYNFIAPEDAVARAKIGDGEEHQARREDAGSISPGERLLVSKLPDLRASIGNLALLPRRLRAFNRCRSKSQTHLTQWLEYSGVEQRPS